MTSTTTTSGNEELVKLNVGGRSFTTYKSTLLAYPDTMLARMFSSSSEIAKKGSSGEYFLDRNPDLFAIILEFYRNKALIVPKATPLEALYNELEYFGIDYEEDDIQIAGEPKYEPVESYVSLVNAYKLLPKKGHLLGKVIMGLPSFDYEEDEDEEDEEDDADNMDDNIDVVEMSNKAKRTKKEYEEIDQMAEESIRLTNALKQTDEENDNESSGSDSSESLNAASDSSEASDLSDSDSPLKKKSKKDKKKDQAGDKELENGPYVKGTHATLEKIKQSLSDIAIDSFFCCGGQSSHKGYSAVLRILPPPIVDASTSNNNNNASPHPANPNPGKKPVCQYGSGCYRKNPAHLQEFFHPAADTSAPKIFWKTKQIISGADTTGSVACGDLKDLNIELIKNMCSPAPFGDLKTMQTKLDPSVRLALECNSDRFSIAINLFDILAYIKTKLNNNKFVKLVPYKLNIYEPGGFFKEHVDTPINPGKMLGSLVVCLPSKHKGGELMVAHNGISHTFDFAPKSGDNTIIQWAAFYSDCVHEVKPVTKGTRVTVTYLIDTTNDKGECDYIKKKKPSKKFFCGPVDATMNLSKVHELLGHLNELPTPLVKIGLFLSHKYTTTAINMETLKGSDRILIENIGAKWNYQLTPVIYNEFTKNYVGEYASDNREYNSRGGYVYAFSMEDLKYLNNRGPKPKHVFTKVPFVVSTQKGKLLYHNADEGAEHTGNDSRPAETDSVYFHAAVILTRKN